MRMKSFYRVLVLTILMTCTAFSAFAKQSVNTNNIVYNFEERNGLLVGQTLYKQEGKALSHYIRYNYTYDQNNKIVENNIQMWNKDKKQWDKSLSVRYEYNGQNVSTQCYKWDANKNSYKLLPKYNTSFIDPNL